MRNRIGLGILVVFLAIGSVAWGMVSENSRQGSDPVFSITHQGVELLNPVSDAGSDGTSEENCIGVNNLAKHLTPYLFTGRKLNSFTGHYANRWRHYNPRVGRFTSSDPIGFAGGYNLWSYANQNPLIYIDPFGLWKLESNGNDIIAIAEENNEDYFELFDPQTGIWGSVEPSQLPPPKTFGVLTDPCRVYAGDKFRINSFFPGAIGSTMGQGGPANCFRSAIDFPNPNPSLPLLPADTFKQIVNGFVGPLANPARGTILNVWSTVVTQRGDPPGTSVHAAVVIYQSKSPNGSGEFYVWHKPGPGPNLRIEIKSLTEVLARRAGWTDSNYWSR